VFQVFSLTNLSPLASVAPVKGVSTFFLGQQDGSICEITIGKKKMVSLYELTDRLTLDRVTCPRLPFSPYFTLNLTRSWSFLSPLCRKSK